VLIGYIHGVAVVLVISQIDAILGLDVDALGSPRQLVEMASELGDTSGATLIVGSAALAVLLPLRFVWPRLPTALFVVVASIAVSWAVDLEAEGVAVVGDIASGLPSLGIPWPGWSDAFQLAPAAVGIFLVAFATTRRRSTRSRTQLASDGGLRAIDVGPLNRAQQLEQLGLLYLTLQEPHSLNFRSTIKVHP
jgi:sulfate permease, SulP family